MIVFDIICLLCFPQAQAEHIGIEKSWIEGNLSGDKKPTVFNSVMGRGLSVTAKATISEDVLHNVLNTSSDSLLELHAVISRITARCNMVGGCNINVANVLAAMFSACGQDIASVAESSLASLDLTRNDGPEGGIIAAMYMPSLVIGTVGGGTNLPTQKECLQIMGCDGAGSVRKLGEIIAAYCLALDISTMSAVVAGEFVKAQEELGRNRPV